MCLLCDSQIARGQTPYYTQNDGWYIQYDSEIRSGPQEEKEEKRKEGMKKQTIVGFANCAFCLLVEWGCKYIVWMSLDVTLIYLYIECKVSNHNDQ